MTTTVKERKSTLSNSRDQRRARPLMKVVEKKPVTRDVIAARAYELFLVRSNNGGRGDQLSDWLRAEDELISGTTV